MARKPRSKSATRSGSGRGGSPRAETAHARRIRLYLEKHPGAPKSAARGHKPAEHATRKERARAAGRLDENERQRVRRYTNLQAPKGGRDPDELYRSTIEWLERKGGGGIRDLERVRALRDRLKKRGRSGVKMRIRKGVATLVGDVTGQERNIGEMDDFMERYDLPDIALLYYG